MGEGGDGWCRRRFVSRGEFEISHKVLLAGGSLARGPCSHRGDRGADCGAERTGAVRPRGGDGAVQLANW